MRRYFQKVFFWFHYLGTPPWDSGITPPELMEFINSTPPGRALDMGCGTGTNAITLAKHGWQVTGVDFVAKVVRIAKRKAIKAKVIVDLRVGDVTRLPDLQPSFDLIYDIGCSHVLNQAALQAYISNLQRLLTPGGTLMVYAHRPSSPGNEHGLSEEDIQMFADKFNLTRRVDSSEGSGGRPSVWLWFNKAINLK
jgi:SAM-dependent methyltransferase